MSKRIDSKRDVLPFFLDCSLSIPGDENEVGNLQRRHWNVPVEHPHTPLLSVAAKESNRHARGCMCSGCMDVLTLMRSVHFQVQWFLTAGGGMPRQ